MLLYSRNKTTRDVLFKCASSLISALPQKEQIFYKCYGAQAVMTWKGDDKTCSKAIPSVLTRDEKRKWDTNTKKENTSPTAGAAQARSISLDIPRIKSSNEKNSFDQSESENISISTKNPHYINTEAKGEMCQPGYVLIAARKQTSDASTPSLSIFKIDTTELRISSASEIPLTSHSVRLVGCCNEFLCTTDHQGDVKIYNTNTNEIQTLPKSEEDLEKYSETYEFGYDPIGNKYKVVKVSRPYYYETEEHDHRIDTSNKETRVEIFTLGESCWRNLQVPHQVRFGYHPFFYHPETVFLDGCFHWEIDTDLDPSHPEAILALDITTEKFHRIDLPSSTEGAGDRKLIKLGNSLAFIDRDTCGSSSSFDIQKVVGSKNNDIQSEHYNVSLNKRGDITWLGMLNDGNLLLHVSSWKFDESSYLTVYNLGTKKYSKLDLPGLPKKFVSMRALVSPMANLGIPKN